MDLLTKLLSPLRTPSDAQRKLKHRLERALGVKVLRSLPLGNNVFADLRSAVPSYRGHVVFDVGANVGQTALDFAFWWPEAHLYCFEPVAQNFEALRAATAKLPNVHCLQSALADAPGSSDMVLSGLTATFRILQDNEQVQGETETVQIDTVDRVCERLAVAYISYLKIDTEGHDLKVLEGAKAMLSRGAVDFVEVEAGMNPHNQLHVPLERMKTLLEGYGYNLFGLYEQRHDFPTGLPILRRANGVFVARHVAEAHRKLVGR